MIQRLLVVISLLPSKLNYYFKGRSLTRISQRGVQSFVFFIFLFCNIGQIQKISAQDTIPPVIISPARDSMMLCSASPDIITALTLWYNEAGYAIAEDDSGQYTFEANLTLQQTVSIFLNSSDTLCGNTRSVTVEFTAVDPSGNRSEPTIARFFTFDNERPGLIIPPNVTISCDVGIRDTLIQWIRNKAGYIATDECSDSFEWTRFQYSISQGNTIIQTGGGSITNGPYPTIPNGVCQWRLNINFWVLDECGNETVTFGTTTFSVTDNRPPVVINPPMNITVSCDQIPPVSQVVFIDGCTQNPDINFTQQDNQDPDSLSCSHYQYTIIRSWVAEDACGNTQNVFQNIVVIDTVPPQISAINNLELYCSAFKEDSVYYTEIIDACSPVLQLNTGRVIDMPSCQYQAVYTYSYEDVCGNRDTFIQNLNILADPLMITKVAENETYYCGNLQDYNSLFGLWLDRRADSEVSVTCGELLSFVAVPGSYNPVEPSTWPGIFPGEFDTQMCPSPLEGFLRGEQVDFVYHDSCGNVVVTTAVFGLLDTLAPQVNLCDQSFRIVLSPDECQTSFTLPVPSASDDCIEGNSPVTRMVSAPIVAIDPTNSDSPIYPVILEIGPFNPAGVFPISDAMIQLRFRRVDMDDATEFFNIFDEDNQPLGRTPHSLSECGDVEMNLTLPMNRLSDWMADGYISLRFEPNHVPGIPRAEINGFCGGSIQSTLSFDIDLTNSIFKSYTLNTGQKINLLSEDTLDLTLPIGEHTLVFHYEDCASNVTACQVDIEVVDEISPTMDCPDNKIILLPENKCLDTVLFPLDQIISLDLCGGNFLYNKKVPISNEASLISFMYQESTGRHLARNKQFLFNNVIPITRRESQIILTLEFYGNNNESYKYFDLLAPDGTTIGSSLTRQSTDSCGLTTTTFILNQDLFNSWIFNGQISFTAIPNISAEGINPCIPLSQTQTTDGISFMKLSLEYSDFAYAYQMDGATSSGLINVPQEATEVVFVLNDGLTGVTFFTGDSNGNKGNCRFEIMMEDRTKPVAICKNAAINIHPSGVEDTPITSLLVNDGSFDLCSPVTYRTEPNFVNCSQSNTDVLVSLIVEDEQGNIDTCTSLIKVKPFELMPSFSSGLCENDTLKLFANVPPSVTPGAYTFHWKGPNNFEFFVENPSIPDVNDSYNGLYTVTVTGFNQCITEGSVFVNIQPLTKPNLQASSETICEGEDVILTSTQFTGNILYDWYEGIAPTGVKIASTNVNTLVLKPLGGVHFYYIIATGENCSSSPSSLLKVTTIAKPVAMIGQLFYAACEGETITLASTNTGSDLTYLWSGPNFTSTQKNPPPIVNVSFVNQGIYTLVVSRGTCNSDTAKANLIILEKPVKPIISSASVFCEGATFSLLVTNVNNGDRYEWYQNGVLRFTTTENNVVIPNVQPNFEGNWHVIVFKGSCFSENSDIKAIAIDNLLQIGVTNSGPICEGDTVQLQATFVPNATYTWQSPDLNQNIPNIYNPRVVAKAGYYSVTITTPTGCQSNEGTVVEIIIPPIITALSSDVDDCIDGSKPITFSPSVFPQNMNYIYQWTSTNGYMSVEPNATIPNPMQGDTGTYTLVVYNDGCPSEPHHISLQFFMIPSQPVILGNTFYCEGDSLTLHSNILLTGQNPRYFWTTPFSGQVTTNLPFLDITPATSLQNGNYTLEIEENGCRSVVSLPFTVEVRPKPNLPAISAASPVCHGSEIQLQSSFSDVHYEWTGPNMFLSNLPMPKISNAGEESEGWYVLRVEKNGCFSNQKDSVFVEILPELRIPQLLGQRYFLCQSSPSFVEICIDPNSVNAQDTMALINATTNDTIMIFQSNCVLLDQNTQGLVSGSNFVYAVVINKNCSSLQSNVVIVELDAAPQFNAGSIQGDFLEICDGGVLILESLLGPPEVDVLWESFNPSIFFSNAVGKSTNVSGMTPGENDIYLHYSFRGCQNFSTDTIRVFVYGNPLATDDEITLPFYTSTTLQVLNNDQYFGDISINIVSQPTSGEIILSDGVFRFEPDITFTGEVFFIYEICSEFCPGLCSSARVNIIVEADKDCRPPNIITPNEDGVNDLFIVPCLYGEQYPGNSLVVFNEWGNEVYAAKNYNNDWNGMYNSNPLPAGTYYFVLDLGNGNKPLNGFLILQR